MALSPYPDNRRVSSRKVRLTECVDHLARLPLFSTVSKRHLRSIARLTHAGQIEAGANLITEGASAGEAFVIIAGTAVVRRGGRKIAEVGVGDVVGEMGMLLNLPRNSTVQAVTPLEYLVVSRNTVKACVAESPELAWLLIEAVAERASS